jgi:hypothetical protein
MFVLGVSAAGGSVRPAPSGLPPPATVLTSHGRASGLSRRHQGEPARLPTSRPAVQFSRSGPRAADLSDPRPGRHGERTPEISAPNCCAARAPGAGATPTDGARTARRHLGAGVRCLFFDNDEKEHRFMPWHLQSSSDPESAAHQVIVRTAAPLTRPSARSCSARSACSNGTGVVVTCTPSR